MYTIDAHAKVNIFLKITGYKNGYHTLLSRFVQVNGLYDTISFIPQLCETFTIQGCDNIPKESNTLYKAYKALNLHTANPAVIEFFNTHKIVVAKRIPSQAGLGGGSSDAAAFMLLVNDICDLRLSASQLAQIGSTIGADLPFFIHRYTSANVSGFGEIVEPFDEAPLALELYTPPLGCDTTQVYKTFKEHFLPSIKPGLFFGWESISSSELLKAVGDPMMLNDLYPAALESYPLLSGYVKPNWFFSGSGSTFFRLKEKDEA
jgi:4-diphosphocytidyl-2-C-methyl-D-erythritol kinase